MHRILHLTDLHLRADPQARLHGWHVQRAFDHVLKHAVTRYPDYSALVLGGDLVDDESEAGYARLDARLASLARPVLALAGNHDDPARMRRRLAHACVHGDLSLGAWSLIALDSRIAGQNSGRLGVEQIRALAEYLAKTPGPALVCLHHPPIATGSAWVDAIGLADADHLRRVLARAPQPCAVVCGHAHQAAEARLGDVDCWISPATMRQFQPDSATFAEDRRRAPGYRVLTLHDDARVTTRVHRVPAARST